MVNSRSKGKRGELEIVHLLNDRGYNAHRGNASFGDPDVVGLPGIHIEVKRREKEQIDAWMAQAIRDAEEKYEHDVIPAVFHRKSGMPWKVTLLLDDFMRIYEQYQMEDVE